MTEEKDKIDEMGSAVRTIARRRIEFLDALKKFKFSIRGLEQRILSIDDSIEFAATGILNNMASVRVTRTYKANEVTQLIEYKIEEATHNTFTEQKELDNHLDEIFTHIGKFNALSIYERRRDKARPKKD